MNFSTVTVIGANGTMGATVAGIIASFGNSKVYMVAKSIDKAILGIEKAVQSVRADAIRAHMIPMTYDNLKECVSQSEWVFESLSEDYIIKKEIYSQILRFRQVGTILTTGTSGLSLKEISKDFNYEQKQLFFGTHFFNPPYNLPLCEVISTKETEEQVLMDFMNFLKEKLYRKVVKVKDSPAFLGNRIGFQFINEVMQQAEVHQYDGGIDYMDAIFGGFTGRGMAPLVTADFVGLDIHKAIVDNIYINTSDIIKDSFILPDYVSELLGENKLGKKTAEGLYKNVYRNSDYKEVYVYDIATKKYRQKQHYHFSFREKMISHLHDGEYTLALKSLLSEQSTESKICISLMLKYILYSLYISENVAQSIHDSDTAMGYGFNWIPPLALVDFLGGKDEFFALCEKYISFDILYKTLDIKHYYNQIEMSHMDYRKYLRARY